MKQILVFVIFLALMACNGKKNSTEEKNIIAMLAESVSKEKSIEGRWVLPRGFKFSGCPMENEMKGFDAMINFCNDSVYLEHWIYKELGNQVYWGTYTIDGSTIDINNTNYKDVQLKYKWAGDDLIIDDQFEMFEQQNRHFIRYTGLVKKRY